MLQVYIDGACEPNPNGIASYGLIIVKETHEGYGSDPAGWEISNEQLLQEGKIIGFGSLMSNNVAEYSALLKFIEWYRANVQDNESALVHSDSNLLVNQMQGKWKAKDGLYYPYYLSAKELIQRHKNISFKWISREENEEADRLSKEAIATWQSTNLNQQKN